jgi:transposase InsO family protein
VRGALFLHEEEREEYYEVYAYYFLYNHHPELSLAGFKTRKLLSLNPDHHVYRVFNEYVLQCASRDQWRRENRGQPWADKWYELCRELNSDDGVFDECLEFLLPEGPAEVGEVASESGNVVICGSATDDGTRGDLLDDELPELVGAQSADYDSILSLLLSSEGDRSPPCEFGDVLAYCSGDDDLQSEVCPARAYVISLGPEDQVPTATSSLEFRSGSYVYHAKYTAGGYDPQDFMLEHDQFNSLQEEFGPFDIDLCADPSGFNAHLSDYGDKVIRPAQQEPLAGRRIYCNPPFRMIKDIISHYLREKAKDPTFTSGLFILPLDESADWWPLVEPMQMVRQWDPPAQLFTLPDPRHPSERRILRPCHFPVCAMFDPPAAAAGSATADASQDALILDSGATHHMTGNLQLLHSYAAGTRYLPQKVAMGNDAKLPVTGAGELKFKSSTGRLVVLQGVLHVQGLARTLLSLSTLMQGAHGLVTEHYFDVFDRSGKLLFRAHPRGRLYRLFQCFPVLPPGPLASTQYASTSDLATLWHMRMGHLSFNRLAELTALADGIPLSKSAFYSKAKDLDSCVSCEAGKGVRDSRQPASAPKATEKLRRLHIDLCGPMEESMGGAKYTLTVVDEATRHSWARPIAAKSDAADSFIQLHLQLERVTGAKLVSVRSDRGREFVNNQLGRHFSQHGVLPELTAPYSPESNGMAERCNRSLMEKVRCMMVWAQCPDSLWAEALAYANILRNFSPATGVPKTPFEMMWGKPPLLSKLGVFGCYAVVHVPEKLRTKLNPRGKPGIFVGYNPQTHCYRVLCDSSSGIPEIVISRDVQLFETKPGWPELYGIEELEDNPRLQFRQAGGEPSAGSARPSLSPSSGGSETVNQTDQLDTFSSDDEDVSPIQNGSAPFSAQSELETGSRELPRSEESGAAPFLGEETTGDSPPADYDDQHGPRRSARNRRPPDRLSPRIGSSYLSLPAGPVGDKIPEPRSWQEAQRSPYRDYWSDAAHAELSAIKNHGTYKLVSPPPGARVLPCKWVFNVKYNADRSIERFKARLVVGGHRQRDGVDFSEVFAPVGRFATLRALLAKAAHCDFELRCVDISNAFLHGKLDPPVYMALPEGFEDGQPGQVWELHKTLYGLKQSPKEWYDVLAQALAAFGFKLSLSDRALFVSDEEPRIYILSWVDDLIMACESERALNAFTSKLLSKFKGRDLGKATRYLNAVIIRDRERRLLTVSQPTHIEDVLRKHSLDADVKTRRIPMSVGADCTSAKEGEKMCDKAVYAETVGALLYISSFTRPDISYAVSVLARHMANPAERHFTILKGVLRYLARTKDVGITFGGLGDVSVPEPLVSFTDSDYASCKDTRRSRTGYVLQLYGGPIAWCSKLQTVVAMSSAESEYIACSAATRETVWLRRVCCDLRIPIVGPVPVNVDNQAAIHMATNASDSARTKHIDVCYHFLRDKVAKREIRTVYVSTNDNLADLFTKPLPESKFVGFCSKLGLRIA